MAAIQVQTLLGTLIMLYSSTWLGQLAFNQQKRVRSSHRAPNLVIICPYRLTVRTLAFQANNTGSNPVRDARLCCHRLIGLGHPPLLVGNRGSTPFDSTKHMSCSSNGLGCLTFNQEDIGSNPIQDTKLMLYSSSG